MVKPESIIRNLRRQAFMDFCAEGSFKVVLLDDAIAAVKKTAQSVTQQEMKEHS
mgnify:CR=1 FL=1